MYVVLDLEDGLPIDNLIDGVRAYAGATGTPRSVFNRTQTSMRVIFDTSFAVNRLTAVVEDKIGKLVKKAAS